MEVVVHTLEEAEAIVEEVVRTTVEEEDLIQAAEADMGEVVAHAVGTAVDVEEDTAAAAVEAEDEDEVASAAEEAEVDLLKSSTLAKFS